MTPERVLLRSGQNPTVKNLLKLRQRRERDRQQRFLIDGARALQRALANGVRFDAMYVAVDVEQQHRAILQQAQAADIAIQAVTPEVFARIGYGDNPDGVLGVARSWSLDLQHFPPVPQPLYLVVEGLEKPGNLGAILRSADAAGVSGCILCTPAVDVWNPNVIRASQGACFTVPLAMAPAATVQAWLRQSCVHVLAAMPAAPCLYTQADMRVPLALVVGAEHCGLTASWQQEPCIRIPMHGQIDSLNVAQAASILLFEAVRQRTAGGLEGQGEEDRAAQLGSQQVALMCHKVEEQEHVIKRSGQG